MDATSELQAPYPTLQDRETKVAAIEAFSIAGDSAMLRQVLSTETDPELRRACIYGIAMEDGEESAEFIESIYGGAASKAEKSTILEALSMMDDAKDLALKIVRTETDPELQREAIQALGIMEATEELGDLYGSLTDPDSRKAVLESMSIADDTDGLFKVLQTEQDEELRAAAIQALAISDDEAAADYLVTLYPNASREEKSALIESMIIMENAPGLISFLKQETDPELKREILQMLSVMDSEETDEYLFELLENKG
jgi:HEAT repeat protein